MISQSMVPYVSNFQISCLIKMWRHAYGISQKKAAQQSGMHPSKWSRLESGQSRLCWTDLECISRQFNVTFHQFLEGPPQWTGSSRVFNAEGDPLDT